MNQSKYVEKKERKLLFQPQERMVHGKIPSGMHTLFTFISNIYFSNWKR